ncbi:MAG: alpha-1,4-glucan--maltose-1-phosphate maltosyltransferase [Candidatus Omnitrophica bacterium]|nr:alpha-1,4-glucan--maltose-1-phosphate maltosyltransferase [Candidatus Omnitrophota bacterium]
MAKKVTVKESNLKQTISAHPRVIIEKVTPQIDGGIFPIKRVVGDRVVVRANVFADGHDQVKADLLYRMASESNWHKTPMKSLGNDAWIAAFSIEEHKNYVYTVRGHACEFSSWCHDLKKRVDAKRDAPVDLQIGSNLIKEAAGRAKGEAQDKLLSWAEDLVKKDHAIAIKLALSEELYQLMAEHFDLEKSVLYPQELIVHVDRVRAGFSSWYEFFPRSWGEKPGVHGTFKEAARILPKIAAMGFDIIYLPPIHPIGQAFRKGKNNATTCSPHDPGSPWAVGSKDGGHKAIHPQLGTMEDFRNFVKEAKQNNLEIAFDIAFQCSQDHPYLKEHPSWFSWRPDGTVQYAENPPKKYEDIVPFNFETKDRIALWEELKSIFIFWAKEGVRVFRVDNPHTKPFLFWDWVISEVKKEFPDAIFLAEAFTRPNIMYRLAKGGFTQSYTYFTWRNTKKEFEEYLTELAQTDASEFFRPNFWPNTPDILAEHLQHAKRPSFVMRAVLASTMSSNFGIYGPAFELCENQPFPGKEEYVDNEKYEIKAWDWDRAGNIKDVLTKLNKIRRENTALQVTRNIRFCKTSNDQILAYYKATPDFSNIILVIVNLDPHHTQSGHVEIPLHTLGIVNDKPYPAHDLLTGEKFTWLGEKTFVELNPVKSVAHVILLTKNVNRDHDFEYYL